MVWMFKVLFAVAVLYQNADSQIPEIDIKSYPLLPPGPGAPIIDAPPGINFGPPLPPPSALLSSSTGTNFPQTSITGPGTTEENVSTSGSITKYPDSITGEASYKVSGGSSSRTEGNHDGVKTYTMPRIVFNKNRSSGSMRNVFFPPRSQQINFSMSNTNTYLNPITSNPTNVAVPALTEKEVSGNLLVGKISSLNDNCTDGTGSGCGVPIQHTPSMDSGDASDAVSLGSVENGKGTVHGAISNDKQNIFSFVNTNMITADCVNGKGPGCGIPIKFEVPETTPVSDTLSDEGVTQANVNKTEIGFDIGKDKVIRDPQNVTTKEPTRNNVYGVLETGSSNETSAIHKTVSSGLLHTYPPSLSTIQKGSNTDTKGASFSFSSKLSDQLKPSSYKIIQDTGFSPKDVKSERNIFSASMFTDVDRSPGGSVAPFQEHQISKSPLEAYIVDVADDGASKTQEAKSEPFVGYNQAIGVDSHHSETTTLGNQNTNDFGIYVAMTSDGTGNIDDNVGIHESNVLNVVQIGTLTGAPLSVKGDQLNMNNSISTDQNLQGIGINKQREQINNQSLNFSLKTQNELNSSADIFINNTTTLPSDTFSGAGKPPIIDPTLVQELISNLTHSDNVSNAEPMATVVIENNQNTGVQKNASSKVQSEKITDDQNILVDNKESKGFIGKMNPDGTCYCYPPPPSSTSKPEVLQAEAKLATMINGNLLIAKVPKTKIPFRDSKFEIPNLIIEPVIIETLPTTPSPQSTTTSHFTLGSDVLSSDESNIVVLAAIPKKEGIMPSTISVTLDPNVGNVVITTSPPPVTTTAASATKTQNDFSLSKETSGAKFSFKKLDKVISETKFPVLSPTFSGNDSGKADDSKDISVDSNLNVINIALNKTTDIETHTVAGSPDVKVQIAGEVPKENVTFTISTTKDGTLLDATNAVSVDISSRDDNIITSTDNISTSVSDNIQDNTPPKPEQADTSVLVLPLNADMYASHFNIEKQPVVVKGLASLETNVSLDGQLASVSIPPIVNITDDQIGLSNASAVEVVQDSLSKDSVQNIKLDIDTSKDSKAQNPDVNKIIVNETVGIQDNVINDVASISIENQTSVISPTGNDVLTDSKPQTLLDITPGVLFKGNYTQGPNIGVASETKIMNAVVMPSIVHTKEDKIEAYVVRGTDIPVPPPSTTAATTKITTTAVPSKTSVVSSASPDIKVITLPADKTKTVYSILSSVDNMKTLVPIDESKLATDETGSIKDSTKPSETITAPAKDSLLGREEVKTIDDPVYFWTPIPEKTAFDIGKLEPVVSALNDIKFNIDMKRTTQPVLPVSSLTPNAGTLSGDLFTPGKDSTISTETKSFGSVAQPVLTDSYVTLPETRDLSDSISMRTDTMTALRKIDTAHFTDKDVSVQLGEPTATDSYVVDDQIVQMESGIPGSSISAISDKSLSDFAGSKVHTFFSLPNVAGAMSSTDVSSVRGPSLPNASVVKDVLLNVPVGPIDHVKQIEVDSLHDIVQKSPDMKTTSSVVATDGLSHGGIDKMAIIPGDKLKTNDAVPQFITSASEVNRFSLTGEHIATDRKFSITEKDTSLGSIQTPLESNIPLTGTTRPVVSGESLNNITKKEAESSVVSSGAPADNSFIIDGAQAWIVGLISGNDAGIQNTSTSVDSTVRQKDTFVTLTPDITPQTTTKSIVSTAAKPKGPNLKALCLLYLGAFIDGVGYAPYPRICQKFVQCFYNGGKLKTLERECPYGMFWDQTLLLCRRPSEVACFDDECLARGASHYPRSEGCRSYFNCVDFISIPSCCPKGFKYTPIAGCVRVAPNEVCDDSCGVPDNFFKIVKGACPSMPDPVNKHGFLISEYGGLRFRRCPAGTIYSDNLCRCTSHFKSDTGGLRARSKECYPEFKMNFDTGFRDISDGGLAFEHRNILIRNNAAKFSGDGQIYIWGFTSRFLGKTFAISLRVKPKRGGGMDKPEPIISNCGRHGDASVEIYIYKGRMRFKAKTSNTDSIVTATTKYIEEEWNTVTYYYNGKIFGGSCGADTFSETMRGNLESRDNPLSIGSCNIDGFHGSIDDVEIYTECVPHSL